MSTNATMAKFSIIEFADGIQMVPTSWLQENNTICLWPNYTNQIKINKAIAKLEEPCELSWSTQTVLRTFGTAKTHGEGIAKLKLAEKLSDLDTADSGEENLLGKRGRHVRAKRRASYDDDDVTESPPPSTKKLAPFPKVPTNFGASNSTATQCPAAEYSSLEWDEGHFLDDPADEDTLTNLTTPEEDPVAERDEGQFVDIFESEWPKLTAPNTSKPTTGGTGLSGSFRQSSKSSSGNTVLVARATNSSKPIQRNTSRSDSGERPQSHLNNRSQAAPMKSSKERTIQENDKGSGDNETILDILKVVLKKVIKISTQLRDVNEKLDDRNEKNLAGDDDESLTGEDHEFPLKDQKAVDKFEMALQDKDYRNKMVQYIKNIGGHAPNTIIVNVLKHTLSDQVALNYSWLGARKKASFNDLNICKMLIKTVRSVSTAITDDQIRNIASKWLAQANLRNTRSLNKSKTGNVAETTEHCAKETAENVLDE